MCPIECRSSLYTCRILNDIIFYASYDISEMYACVILHCVKLYKCILKMSTYVN